MMNQIGDPVAKLFGKKHHPYFIYTPRWIDESAGIKVLHLLCHALNISGNQAYLIFTEPCFLNQPRINPALKTPILTQEQADAFFEANLNPIVIYSETIPGNPLGAQVEVRYLLNYPGALGGDETFQRDALIWAYAKSISETYKGFEDDYSPNVLFLPAIDPREFVFTEKKENYQTSYAGKYRAFMGIPPKVGSLENFEILREGPKSQPRHIAMNILRNAQVAYIFENSSVITEAILSGTTVALVKSSFFENVIADSELGLDLLPRVNPGETILPLNNNDLILMRDKYIESIEKFWIQLEMFIEETQKFASTGPSAKRILIPMFTNGTITRHRYQLAWQILRSQGLSVLLRTIVNFFMRRLAFKNRKETAKAK